MKTFLNKRIRGESLTKEEAQTALLGIGRGEINNSQIAAFLTSYMMKSVTVHELEGFRDAMLELAISVDLSEFDPMDVCGTGGDGKDTFNISTTSSFILAGAGQNVAKHGNHGVSSSVGSSTVLEYLGVKFTNDYDYLRSKIRYVIAINHFKDELFLYEHQYSGEQTNPEKSVKGLEFLEMLLNMPHYATKSFKVSGEEKTNFTDEEMRAIIQECIKHCLNNRPHFFMLRLLHNRQSPLQQSHLHLLFL